jgi:dienelactone hydrolase
VVETVGLTIDIPLERIRLKADVAVPTSARGVVLFAHGSGSGRHSPRNRQVAGVLQEAGLATVLADLLTAEEERIDRITAGRRFDIGLLSARLIALIDWIGGGHEPLARLPIGLFGASTGAAAAIVAAASRPDTVATVVSRGGRPDLAGPALRSLFQPTLLIVGSRDEVVIDLNRQAMQSVPGPVHLEIVPGATHLFEEAGALEQVETLACDWFARHLEGDFPR